ncbi:MAG TPA: methylenetetrahydrofolate--tRNA-(uracil(54)-C(5))-methyltransferase (FADH(2)-oxidizing) TrmFO [Polyangiaceae bacterium]|jgi:methylenetetrahydrofolate--tRNA-(uracil-5-)-methyltransferase|nr:MAG: Methylenetetrahydrofolate--tRNA-(uracil-5-)-methyltransferase TrmFO [Deltaproteobacteria bacterium ADurb.Bin207]HNS95898.1 methylenetetrahydrofolate--tRNA-(uracil(54)-C(5))-methyltransferase (FADH(2)-oxidizing) TrmFO [Polyangiaceae bacterium]HNZ24540.1 methylenetetrahydrofolate--tRNA-(uracil(54)-C(5))-methyltransferase (FADH(2)-oxidizing) TrmFO [Polyangiaceae bacterium]HOD21974.1 methylenetetrahydrofolate--tRNA-(uracil(54)-C(5))-methyltransferase (FADH(2)-oxidizing) TrmFO [Polyangiaceae 
MNIVTVVGAGLAGSECAWQLAEQGFAVRLVEMRPARTTAAHQTGLFAELVCSNSLRSGDVANAVGTLKQELLACDSLIVRLAHQHRVPAGGAVAVDRLSFAQAVTHAICSHPRIEVVQEHLDAIPKARPCVLATGPLTSDALASDLSRVLGSDNLHYYDAIAPIVAADSIDWDIVFKQSRYDRSDRQSEEDAQAYVNCPLDRTQYETFVSALQQADRVRPHAFEQSQFFEGCLPIEEMAQRGPMTLAFGPMKPVGLMNPRTHERPYAVVQLRLENREKTAYNIVGFQTRLTRPEQNRVFRMIPGLENAEFLRWGAIHRNTFVDAPAVLDETLQLRALDGVFLAGQITGVEGYVESCACGLLCARLLVDRLNGRIPCLPPETTTMGGLLRYLSQSRKPFQPSNITWAHVPPLEGRFKKHEKKAALAARALRDIEVWRDAQR